MNVGELLRERDRLIGVLDEAKTARVKLKQVNKLIAMYGNEENVTTIGGFICDIKGCDGRAFASKQALAMHKWKGHGIRGTSKSAIQRKIS